MHDDLSEIPVEDDVEAHKLASNTNEDAVDEDEDVDAHKLTGNTNEDAVADEDDDVQAHIR